MERMALVATGRGQQVVEVAPTHCAAGHRLRPPNVAVSWQGCSCQDGPGHRTWRCLECGHVSYDPIHTDPSQALGRVRGR